MNEGQCEIPRELNPYKLIKKGLFEAVMGEAHQYLVAGILMRLGFYISLFPVRTGTYDIIVVGYRKPGGKQVLIRTQVRTLDKKGNLKLVGGRRAGKGMIPLELYKKGYKYTTKHNDLIIGIDREKLTLYFVPTKLTQKLGKSMGKKLLKLFKNRYEFLRNWNEEYFANFKELMLKTIGQKIKKLKQS